MATIEAPEITPDDLLSMEDAGHYELVDGRLVERNVSTDSSEVAMYVGHELVGYCRAHGTGRVYDSELGIRAFPDAPNLVRRADVAFVAADRVPAEPTGYLRVMPDLVVEVVSLGDNAQDVRNKVDVWLDGGVRMVWVVYPNVREVIVFRAGHRAAVLTAEDQIDGEDVIPGFTCPVANFFPVPLPVDQP